MPDPVDLFISRWQSSGAAERANYVLFLSELCDLLDVPRPDPTSPDPAKNRYVFERAVTRVAPDGTSSSGFIDLYRAGHFVLETKQGAGDPAIDPDPHGLIGAKVPVPPPGVPPGSNSQSLSAPFYKSDFLTASSLNFVRSHSSTFFWSSIVARLSCASNWRRSGLIGAAF